MTCGYCLKPITETGTFEVRFGPMHIECWHLAKDREQLRGLSPVNCPWWSRWYHRSLRNLDRRVMLTAIQLAALKASQMHSWSEQQMRDKVAVVWALFKSQDGQEHWCCPCAQRER